MHRKINVLNRG